MSQIHTINELKQLIGVSEGTIYNRLSQFSGFLSDEIRKGDHNKNLVTENGRQILERIEELRRQNYSLERIREKINEELDSNHKEEVSDPREPSEGSMIVNEVLKEEITLLKERVESLENQLEERNQEIKRLHQILQNRLPPSQEEARQKVEKREGVWRRFKKFLGSI